MSLKSWKREYYPITATKAAEKENSDAFVIEHSLTKWIGLRQVNRERHEVTNESAELKGRHNELALEINAWSCSLCARFYKEKAEGSTCVECPLYKVRGGVPCDERISTVEGLVEYEYESPLSGVPCQR